LHTTVNNSFDAVVVGAGVVGAACAKELAEGGVQVAICEQNGYAGGGATAAGMGHLAIMDDSDARFALTSYSQSLWRELVAELPAEAEYLPCGALWIAADEEEFAEVERKFRFYQGRNIPVEILDSRQIAEAEPNLRAGLAGGLLLPTDASATRRVRPITWRSERSPPAEKSFSASTWLRCWRPAYDLKTKLFWRPG
jgi:glycine/D-amino acid oxidase-like deaminating enzyme